MRAFVATTAAVAPHRRVRPMKQVTPKKLCGGGKTPDALWYAMARDAANEAFAKMDASGVTLRSPRNFFRLSASASAPTELRMDEMSCEQIEWADAGAQLHVPSLPRVTRRCAR